MSTVRFNTLTDASGDNSMPVADINQGRAKAWLNLNGTGVIATRDSFNVSSVIDSGLATYTVNFSSARPNADYVTGVNIGASGVYGVPYFDTGTYTKTTSAYQFGTVYASSLAAAVAGADYPVVLLSVHGD